MNSNRKMHRTFVKISSKNSASGLEPRVEKVADFASRGKNDEKIIRSILKNATYFTRM